MSLDERSPVVEHRELQRHYMRLMAADAAREAWQDHLEREWMESPEAEEARHLNQMWARYRVEGEVRYERDHG